MSTNFLATNQHSDVSARGRKREMCDDEEKKGDMCGRVKEHGEWCQKRLEDNDSSWESQLVETRDV